jgi:hypothetical protein
MVNLRTSNTLYELKKILKAPFVWVGAQIHALWLRIVMGFFVVLYVLRDIRQLLFRIFVASWVLKIRKLILNLVLTAQNAHDEIIIDRLEKLEEEWRDNRLPELQQRTRRGDDLAIAERLAHAQHSRMAARNWEPETERDMLERVYRQNISESEV